MCYKKLFSSIYSQMEQRAEDSGSQMITFGIFGFIAYPLFYFLNLHLLTPQTYSNLSLRIIASLLCLGLIFKNYWPEKLRPYIPVYWYFTLLYGLPFFFTFMMLKNDASNAWLLNILTVIFFTILVIDWVSAIILFIIGGTLGWLAYYLTASHPLMFKSQSVSYSDFIGTYVVTIVLGLIFSRNKEKIQKEKLKTTATVSASIAHELRTPLRTISSGITGIKKCLPALIDTYDQARQQKMNVPAIDTQLYKSLPTIFNNVESETQAAFIIIDMLLVKVNQLGVKAIQTKTCSIAYCINETLRRYPFDSGERELIHWDDKNDFIFIGDELLIIHVLFNLIKNSLYYIRAARKGKIQIWLEMIEENNILHFKDTGTGIPPRVLPYIFDRFFTQTPHGTGIGLAFCKAVMDNLGGKIACYSKEGEYTEFVLFFPPQAT